MFFRAPPGINKIKLQQGVASDSNYRQHLYLFPQVPPTGADILTVLFMHCRPHWRKIRTDMLAGFRFRGKDPAARKPDNAFLCPFVEPDRDERR